MGTVMLAARVLLGAVFLVAALGKLPDPAASRQTLRDFGASEPFARLGVLLAPAELAVAAGLIVVSTAQWAAAGASALLIIFIGGMVHALRLGRRPDCGCFGGIRPQPIGRSTIGRNGLLLVLALAVLALGPGPAPATWVRDHGAGEIAAVGLMIMIAVASIVSGAGTHGRGATAPPAAAEIRLHAGERAPDFRAPDLTGQPQTLGTLLSAGEPLVLVFASAGCGSCAALLTQLSGWQETMTGRLRLTVIGTGSGDQAQLIHEQYGVDEVLTDRGTEIFRAYGARITPSAFAITPDGVIRSGPALGYEAIEELIRLTLRHGEPMAGKWQQTIQVG